MSMRGRVLALTHHSKASYIPQKGAQSDFELSSIPSGVAWVANTFRPFRQYVSDFVLIVIVVVI